MMFTKSKCNRVRFTFGLLNPLLTTRGMSTESPVSRLISFRLSPRPSLLPFICRFIQTEQTPDRHRRSIKLYRAVDFDENETSIDTGHLSLLNSPDRIK